MDQSGDGQIWLYALAKTGERGGRWDQIVFRSLYHCKQTTITTTTVGMTTTSVCSLLWRRGSGGGNIPGAVEEIPLRSTAKESPDLALHLRLCVCVRFNVSCHLDRQGGTFFLHGRRRCGLTPRFLLFSLRGGDDCFLTYIVSFLFFSLCIFIDFL